MSAFMWACYVAILLTVSFALYYVVACFITPTEGYKSRGIFTLSLFMLPTLSGIRRWLLAAIDLRMKKKILIKSTNYSVSTIKNDTWLIVNDLKRSKFKIYEGMAAMINCDEPVEITFAKYSKILLSISNGDCNLLDKFEEDDLKESRS